MHFSLSPTVIADNARATAAFAALSADSNERRALSPILDPKRRGLLVAAVRNAFAETILQIAPFVDFCRLDAETATVAPDHIEPDNDGEDALMEVDIRLPKSLGSVAAWSIRRSLEEIVAQKALSRLIAAVPEASGAADRFALLASTSLSLLRSSLTIPPASPLIRSPWP